jgi:hypothetical protein
MKRKQSCQNPEISPSPSELQINTESNFTAIHKAMSRVCCQEISKIYKLSNQK